MKNRIRSIVAILLLIFALANHSEAQSQKPLVVTLKTGTSVALSTRSDPADSALLFSSQVVVEFDGVIHRLIINQAAGYYFGYNLVITRLPETRQFSVMVRPLDPEYDQSVASRTLFKTRNIGHPDQKGLTAALTKPSQPQIVDDGASVAIDLLINATTGAKIFDVLKLSFDDLTPNNSPLRAPLRDFTLDDVELNVNNYRLTVNGNLVASELSSGFSAPILWFYLPGKGRFIFSINPHAGYNFQKIGVADHNTLSFAVNGDNYLWSSTSPIIERGGHWNIWVLHVPDYKPDDDPVTASKFRTPNNASSGNSVDPLCWGRATRIEDLFPKRNNN